MSHKQLEQQFRLADIEYDSSAEVLDKYATDESIFEVRPQLIVFPRNTKDVRQIVTIISDAKEAGMDASLTARAAGTGLSGGPLNDSVIMDTTKYLTSMSVIEHNEDGTARVRVKPGKLFKDFDVETKKVGYFLPPYPSSRDICTVGGMVANNAAGPNSLKYGHTASFVRSLEVVLADAEAYELSPLTYEQLKNELHRTDLLGDVYRKVWQLLEEHYDTIKEARPKSSKNSAGYLLWEVLHAESLEAFKGGEGHFHLFPLFAGSQGTLGIITDITFNMLPIPTESPLVLVPITKLESIGAAIQCVLRYKPYNVEIFDRKTYELALGNLYFFRKQFFSGDWLGWFKFVANFLTNHITRFSGRAPEFVLLVKFDGANAAEANKHITNVCLALDEQDCSAWPLSRGAEDMIWKIRFASYTLAKLQDTNKRPAAFLEDMVIPPKNLPGFLKELDELLEKYQAEYAMHGHGGDGHFHFYPLMDFTDPNTPEKIKSMADDFFALAKKHDGNICGEHNDGIIRTPYLSLLFSGEVLTLFERLEHAFDPDDIFNPGKKVHPKFEITSCIRSRN